MNWAITSFQNLFLLMKKPLLLSLFTIAIYFLSTVSSFAKPIKIKPIFVSGDCFAQVTGKKTPLVTMTTYQVNNISLAKNAHCVISLSNGHLLEFTGPKTITSATLQSKASRPSLLNKYSELLISHFQNDKSINHYSTGYSKFIDTFSTKYNSFDSLSYALFSRCNYFSGCSSFHQFTYYFGLNNASYFYNPSIRFSNIKKDKITISIQNLYEETLYQVETLGNKVIIDWSKIDEEEIKETGLLVNFSTKDNRSKKEENHTLGSYRVVGLEESVISGIKAIEKEIGNSGLDQIIMAYAFIDKECYLDAIDCFANAIEQSPQNEFYKKCYVNFFKHVILTNDSHSVTRKPVVYLYPEKTDTIDVQVDFKGQLTFTYPTYGNGWKVIAQPNGQLQNLADNLAYNYLFWEGENAQNLRSLINPNEGYMVKGSESIEFLQKILPQYGLLPHEYHDFIVYWAPFMQLNKYNKVHFLVDDSCNAIAKLNTSPKADQQIRVYMVYEGMSQPVSLQQPTIRKVTRKGFTLVEWGGAEIGVSMQQVSNMK